jgi:hypothetical protein
MSMWSLQKHGPILGITMHQENGFPLDQVTAVSTDYYKWRLYDYYPIITPELHFQRAPDLTSIKMVVRQGNLTVLYKYNQ